MGVERGTASRISLTLDPLMLFFPLATRSTCFFVRYVVNGETSLCIFSCSLLLLHRWCNDTLSNLLGIRGEKQGKVRTSRQGKSERVGGVFLGRISATITIPPFQAETS